jgi:hypothetical protein
LDRRGRPIQGFLAAFAEHLEDLALLRVLGGFSGGYKA